MGPGQVGGVHVPLHLGERDRRLGDPARGERDAVERVLPALVDQALVGGALILDEAVTVPVAARGDPVERPVGVGEQLVHGVGGEPPPGQLAEQHDEQRRGVRGAVVRAPAAQRQRGVPAGPGLVQDPARLLLGQRVVPLALEAGQGPQRAQRQGHVQRQQHPRGDQGVAAEQGHEPGRTSGDDLVLGPLPAAAPEDPQRAHVLGAGRERFGEPLVRGQQPGAAAAPVGQPPGRRRALDGLALGVVHGRGLAVQGRRDQQGGRPASPVRDHHLPGQQPGRGRRAARARDRHAAHAGTAPAAQPEGALLGALLHVVLVIVRAGAALLDLEQVGEIAVHGHRQARRGRLPAEVAQRDVVAHAVPDVAPADHQQGAVGPPDPRRSAGQERARERLGRLHGHGLGGLALQHELQPADEPGIAEEQALGAARPDVTGRLTDAEGGLFQQGDQATAGPPDHRRLSAGRPGVCHGRMFAHPAARGRPLREIALPEGG